VHERRGIGAESGAERVENLVSESGAVSGRVRKRWSGDGWSWSGTERWAL